MATPSDIEKGLMAFEVKRRTGCSAVRAVEAVEEGLAIFEDPLTPEYVIQAIECSMELVEAGWRKP